MKASKSYYFFIKLTGRYYASCDW